MSAESQHAYLKTNGGHPGPYAETNGSAYYSDPQSTSTQTVNQGPPNGEVPHENRGLPNGRRNDNSDQTDETNTESNYAYNHAVRLTSVKDIRPAVGHVHEY